MQSKMLGEILIEKKLITPEQLQEALARQKRTQETLGTVILHKKWIKDKDLVEALSVQFGIPIVDLKNKGIDVELLKSFDASVLFDHKCLPLSKDRTSITVAVTNPMDLWAISKIEEMVSPLSVNMMLTSESDMLDALARYKQYLKAQLNQQLNNQGPSNA
ncbi:MAG: hypothetical protein KKC84_01535 [Candidatus Omnitrophica bacterium]|nr:hypothetical protein [Candidatus Omnitrophota bacterium]